MTIGLPTTDEFILSTRPAKHAVDPSRPYAFQIEKECQVDGNVDDVAVVFLTNLECPFRCLMCDLWKYTTDEPVPIGAIPEQIDFALRRLPSARHIKLYNSGNFFDPAAIPPVDYAQIAKRVQGFETTIVENHPLMCGDRVRRFRDCLQASEVQSRLEVAMGLETVHPRVLPMLNKRMTTDRFRLACDYLHSLGVSIRAFVLLRPPLLSEQEGQDWALKSIEFAFDCGVATVSVIPTRAGNGIMDRLQSTGQFSPPTFESLENVFDAGLNLNRGRVFVDLWDAESWIDKSTHSLARLERLRRMNLCQRILPLPKAHAHAESNQ